MKIFKAIFGAFQKKPPETIESLKEEISRLNYLIKHGYNEDIPALKEEMADAEERRAKLQAERDENAVQAASSAK